MILTMLIAPFMLTILGVFIKLGKASFLIAGYNTSSKEEKEKYDEKALCNFVGNLLFVIAGILLLPVVAIALELAYLTFVAISSTILVLLVAIVSAVYANTGNRFKKH